MFIILGNGFTGLLNYYRAVMRGDLDKRMFIFIEVFIFIVWGVKDMVLNENLLEFSKKYIKDCIIKYVEEVIYWV